MNDMTAARPPIHILESEADTLFNLALGAERRQPEVAALLQTEIDRAEIHAEGELPAKVVAMNSHVAFVDESNGQRREVQLVYPQDADIEAGRISILTLVGAGLIGLSEGQSIVWPDREGHERRLRIEKVRPAED